MKLVAGFLLYLNVLCFSAVNSGCNKDGKQQTDSIAQQTYMNVAYGTAALQKMDVYLPAGRTAENTKTIVFIHGGSWSSGDKSEFDTAISVLRRQLKDYAFFNLNYRLASSSGNKFPAQSDDITAALDFITGKAAEYQIDANKIVLVGASAGAHLALLEAYKNNSSGRIKAVVDLFGPTDLLALYNNHPFPAASQPAIANLLGTTPSKNSEKYRLASPINYVSATSVPTLIFHGSGDFVVPVVQSTALKTKLNSYKAKVDMVVYPNEGHGWFGSNLFDTYNKTISFIQENLR